RPQRAFCRLVLYGRRLGLPEAKAHEAGRAEVATSRKKSRSDKQSGGYGEQGPEPLGLLLADFAFTGGDLRHAAGRQGQIRRAQVVLFHQKPEHLSRRGLGSSILSSFVLLNHGEQSVEQRVLGGAEAV